MRKARRGGGKIAASPTMEEVANLGSASSIIEAVVSARPRDTLREKSLFDGDSQEQQRLPPDERSAALQIIQGEVAACTRCSELASTRTQTVFGVGSPTARICFIGEAPGADEDRLGEPFVGRAGQLLTKMILACGLKREEVYILNVLKCRPPGNRTPQPDEVSNCRGYLERQLEIIQPEIICCFGCRGRTSRALDRSHYRQIAGIVSRVRWHSRYLHLSPGVSAAEPGGQGRCLGRFEEDDAEAGRRTEVVRRTNKEFF